MYVCTCVHSHVPNCIFDLSSINLLLASYNHKRLVVNFVTPGLNKIVMDLSLQLIRRHQIELIKKLILHCASAYKLLREAV